MRIIVGLSGASGAIVGIRLLQVLKDIPSVETHLVATRAAGQTIALETPWTVSRVRALADHVYRIDDVAAPISSGSFAIDAMVIVPASMRTVAAIAMGLDDNLLIRAANVTLKERRPLVLCPRETPLHLGHLRAMVSVTEIGAMVAPLMPAFYIRPTSVDQLVDHAVGRVLDLIGVDTPPDLLRRWAGPRGHHLDDTGLAE